MYFFYFNICNIIFRIISPRFPIQPKHFIRSEMLLDMICKFVCLAERCGKTGNEWKGRDGRENAN